MSVCYEPLSVLQVCSDNFSLGIGIKLGASGFAHHQTCHSSRCQVIASQHSPSGHVTQKIGGQDKRMLNFGDSECSERCVQGWIQWMLKEITALPRCIRLTHGTLSAPVHCGRLISAKKCGLQAALNSDGCFSAPGTLGGAATGELPNTDKKDEGKKATRGDSGKNGCWTNNVSISSLCVCVCVCVQIFNSVQKCCFA